MSDSVKKFYDRHSQSHRAYPGDIIIQDITPKQDKYVQQVKAKFEERSQTGIKKYNTTLERNDLSLLEWLTHLQEELMDATLYIERLKDETTKEG